MAAILSLVVSSAAYAEPVMYTFTGVLGEASYFQSTNGAVTDLEGVAFTARGFADAPLSAWGQEFFAATTTYDFGSYGSFTTDVGADTYYQDQWIDGQPIHTVGLMFVFNQVGMVDGQGFRLDLPTPVILDEHSQIQTFDLQTMEQIRYAPFEARTQKNSAGEVFFSASGLLGFTPMILTSAQVQRVPEPGTLSLLAIGAGLLLKRRHGLGV